MILFEGLAPRLLLLTIDLSHDTRDRLLSVLLSVSLVFY